MSKTYLMLITSIIFFWNPMAFADVDDVINQLQSKPYKIPNASSENNQKIFSRYCSGKAFDLNQPQPKYENSLVKKAAKILDGTQDDANEKLLELFKESWKSTISQIKDSLNELKSSRNPVIINIIQKIENSLDETATEFTDQQNKWYETLVDATYSDIKNSLNNLSNVVTEFKGIDYVSMKKWISTFNKRIQGELKSVDVQKLKNLAVSFETEFKSYEGSIDVAALKVAMLTLKDEFTSLSAKDEQFKWAVQNIDYVLEELEKDPVNSENIRYILQDVVSFFTDEYYNEIEYSDGALKQSKVVITQNMILMTETSLQVLDVLIQAVDDYLDGSGDINEIRWAADDLSRTLILYISASSDVNFVTSAKSFSGESSAFNSENLKASVNQIEMMLLDSDSSNDQQAISSVVSLKYEIDNAKNLLSKSSLDQFSKIYAEAKKIEQEEVEQSLNNLIDLSAISSAATFIDESSWQVSNLSRMLEDQKANLSMASQKAIEAFTVVSNSFNVISQLKYQMSSEVELKKASHYYFYGHVKRIYKVNSGSAPYGRLAHTFLVQLCGEFRDRATMIEAKLKWITRLYTIGDAHVGSAIDYSENIWKQMSAEDYYPFLDMTRELWQARKNSDDHYIQIGQYENVDAPVKGPTVCETKYIFDKYIKKKKSFDSLEQYLADYENTYKAKCKIKADLVDYYDFRGDSNFKHYSPESNGMIWKATSIARACSNPWKAKSSLSGNSNAYTDEDCQDYFKRPFYYRYNAARSALATGLVYDSQFNDSFDSEGNAPVKVYSHMSPQYAPMAFETETSNGVVYSFAPEWLDLKQWNQSDIGFNDFTGLGSSNPNMELAYERLRGSVDRHTNWYSAGYDDGNGTVKDQAFSPFVASSYVMSASDEFTSCGITVQCPPDGLKRWMFIFRVKPENWYNPQRILNNEPIDFDKMWFDETSFGDSGLANGESAWDRLGTAMESELDSILYLINVDGGGDFHGEFDEGPMD